MYRRKRKNFKKRVLSAVLACSMVISGVLMLPLENGTVFAAESVIEIASAEDLAKIGKDTSYPMNGDYELTDDIDLSSIDNWTPIGGASGDQYGLVSGDRVFSGTFDGKGHAITGLTIAYDGSKSTESTNSSGLFAMIGSDSDSDYAEVKNLQFTDVSITHTLGGGDTIGTLTGDVNGFVKIDNIAVLSGSITVNGGSTVYGKAGDLIGVGGIVGETRRNESAVQMSHLYNAASVTVAENAANEQKRCGGIIGRIHQESTIGSLSSSVNVGTVTFRGGLGYAINGFSSNTEAAANTENITNCFYLEGSGEDMGASVSKSKAALASDETLNILGKDYWTVNDGALIPAMSDGVMVIPIPSPEFAQGDKASSVTQDFTLPLSFVSDMGEEAISWTSDHTDVISIDPATGLATVHGVLADTQVTLTALTSVSKRTKTVKVTVVSKLSLSFDKEYAKPDSAMTASVLNAPEGTAFTYSWLVDKTEVSQSASYTPKQSDLNKFITARAMIGDSLAAEKQIYCSKLPVVYIDTKDGYGITSKTVYKDASMHIQGNDRFNSSTTSLYDGEISIRGRGNSTWNTAFSKLPYKIKLDKKTNLMGFGNSKHWALLANYMDESLIRNTTSYDLSGAMGMNYLKSTHVELIFNGVYAGNYQLVGNVRIDDDRVNIHDWEDTAGDVAKAITKEEKKNGTTIDQDALEDYLNQNMQWITSDRVEYNGKTYQISKYYTEIPKTADGKVDVSGGFLFELDTYYDEISKFMTDYKQPIMVKNPEFIRPTIGRGYENPSITEDTSYQNCTELYQYARQYMQAVEDSIHSEDYYVEIKKDGETSDAAGFTEDYAGKQHYTDLVDMDSFVRYLMLNEFYWNTETMKKSTYMYKDLGEKLYIGPVWDMDWTSNSLVSAGETGNYSVWMVKTAKTECQTESWYRYLIGDPYFVEKLYECFWENKQNFEDIVKTGGIIDQEKEYLAESAAANYNYGYLQHRSDFNTETERLRTFLNNRLNWLNTQFTSYPKLLQSLGAYQASDSILVSVDTSNAVSTTYTANVTDSSITKVGFYINGRLADIVDVSGQTASLTVNDNEYLERKEGAANIVQVRAMNASGVMKSVSNYERFEKEVQKEILKGTVTINGTAVVGSVLTAKVTLENGTGELSYQWKADGTAIEQATSEAYTLTEKEQGKTITVEVSSSLEEGILIGELSEKVAAKPEVKNDHILIHQVYGGGGKGDTAVSHGFIELYNPTDASISLEGCSILYRSNRNADAPVSETLTFEKEEIPAHTSYLIRCKAQDTTTEFALTIADEDTDKDWDVEIDNKQYQVILYKGTDKVDGVSVFEEAVEGEAIPDGQISKQKAVRRKNFADTDNNVSDFEVIEYKGADADKIALYKPRSLASGVWPDSGETSPAISGTVSIRGNALAGALLYADDGKVLKTDINDSLTYQWYVDETAANGADGPFYTVSEKDIGKNISVIVKSSNDTACSLSASMDSDIKAVTVQRDHIIINQVYGSGGKKTPPVSHSFIELYNPTSKDVDLSSYQIEYLSGGETSEWNLSGTIASGTSYLIQGQATENEDGFVVTVLKPDIVWENHTIDNKRYSIVLKNGENQIDAVSVNEAEVEGTALVDPERDEIISKNKAIRRIGFVDTDNNANDFEVINYDKLNTYGYTDLIASVKPKSSIDGTWGIGSVPENPDKPDEELVNSLNTVLDSLSEYTASKYTEDSWEKLQAAKTQAVNALKSDNNTEIKNALENLNKAIADLKTKPTSPDSPNPDKPDAGLVKSLNIAIASLSVYSASKYTTDSWQKLQAAKTQASNALKSGNNTEIKKALDNLNNAISNLKIKPTSSGSQNSNKKIPAVGTKFQYGTGWYQVLTSSVSGGTVKYLKPLKKTYTNLTIPSEVKEQEITFKVTAINAKALRGNKKLKKIIIGSNVTEIGSLAFSGNSKLKTIIVHSNVLKKVGKKALKGIHANCKIKVSKKKIKDYKKLFKNKGQKSSVKVVKK